MEKVIILELVKMAEKDSRLRDILFGTLLAISCIVIGHKLAKS